MATNTSVRSPNRSTNSNRTQPHLLNSLEVPLFPAPPPQFFSPQYLPSVRFNPYGRDQHQHGRNAQNNGPPISPNLDLVLPHPRPFRTIEDREAHSLSNMHRYVERRLFLECTNSFLPEVEDMNNKMREQMEREKLEPKVHTLQRMIQLQVFGKLFEIIYNRMSPENKAGYMWCYPIIRKSMGQSEFARLCDDYYYLLACHPKICIGLPRLKIDLSFDFKSSEIFKMKSYEVISGKPEIGNTSSSSAQSTSNNVFEAGSSSSSSVQSVPYGTFPVFTNSIMVPFSPAPPPQFHPQYNTERVQNNRPPVRLNPNGREQHQQDRNNSNRVQNNRPPVRYHPYGRDQHQQDRNATNNSQDNRFSVSCNPHNENMDLDEWYRLMRSRIGDSGYCERWHFSRQLTPDEQNRSNDNFCKYIERRQAKRRRERNKYASCDTFDELDKRNELERREPKDYSLKRMTQLNVFTKLFDIIYKRMSSYQKKKFSWIKPVFPQFMGDIEFARFCDHYNMVLEDFPKICYDLPRLKEDLSFDFKSSELFKVKSFEVLSRKPKVRK